MYSTINHTDGSKTTIWIVYFNEYECEDMNKQEGLCETSGDTLYEPGYYWCSCMPGCIPDSDFFGPFSNKEEVENAAKEMFDY
jgi:hypothetical protein